MKSRFMRYPGFRPKAVTLSYDDGTIYDRRLIEIMSGYGVYGTFNLNSGFMSGRDDGYHIYKEDVPKQYLDTGNEVALHGRYHMSLADYPDQDGIADVYEDRLEWERICGRPIRGMAYANGSYSDRVVDYLGKLGVKYSRTTVSTRGFALPKDWLRLPATCHHNDPKLDELTDEFVSLDLSKQYNKQPKLFYLWGHSYEFNNNGNWDVIERFCEKIGGHDDIWYATNGMIYDYVKAYESLDFTLDGDAVFNPTSTDVCFVSDGTEYDVKAGESLRIG